MSQIQQISLRHCGHCFTIDAINIFCSSFKVPKGQIELTLIAISELLDVHAESALKSKDFELNYCSMLLGLAKKYLKA
jgi:hypothetical protein